jgi:hypothetical protein
MNKFIPYLLTLIAGICFSIYAYQLNIKSPINNLDFYRILNGEHPDKIALEKDLKDYILHQIKFENQSSTDSLITNFLTKNIEKSALILTTIQELMYLNTVLVSDASFNKETYIFRTLINPPNPFYVEICLEKKGNVYYVYKITNIKTLIKLSSSCIANEKVF